MRQANFGGERLREHAGMIGRLDMEILGGRHHLIPPSSSSSSRPKVIES
jgi:hypothetical protein